MKELVGSLRRIGALFFLGFLLVCSLGLGAIYLQQGMRQKDLREQIAKLSLTAAQPLPGVEKIKSEYEAVVSSIPLPESKTIIDRFVEIAKDSGIDIDPQKEKFYIPPQSAVKDEKVGDVTYQVITFRDVKAQGNYENVIKFIANMEGGSKLPTAVVKVVNLSQSKLKGKEESEYTAILTVDVYTKRKG